MHPEVEFSNYPHRRTRRKGHYKIINGRSIWHSSCDAKYSFAKLSEEDKQLIVDLRIKGKNITIIASIIGCTPQNIHHFLKINHPGLASIKPSPVQRPFFKCQCCSKKFLARYYRYEKKQNLFCGRCIKFASFVVDNALIYDEMKNILSKKTCFHDGSHGLRACGEKFFPGKKYPTTRAHQFIKTYENNLVKYNEARK